MKSKPKKTLPRVLSVMETWGFGMTGHLVWILVIPFFLGQLGASAMYIWFPLSIISIISCLQAWKLALLFPDVAGGIPSYVYRLFPKRKFLSGYVAVGYYLGWLASFAWIGYIIVELIESAFTEVMVGDLTLVWVLIFSLLGFVVAFSSTKALILLQNLFVILPMLILTIFSLYGFGWLVFSPQSPGILMDSLPSIDFNSAVVFMSYGFVNLLYMDTATVIMADSKNPKSTANFLPISAVLFFILFVIGGWVVLRIVPENSDALSYAVIERAFSVLFGGVGKYLAVITILGACLCSLSAGVLTVPRVLYQLGKDGILRSLFAYTNKQGTIVFSLLVSVFFAVLFVFLGGVETLYVSVGMGYMLSYIAINFGIWKNRKNLTRGIFPKTSLIIGVVELVVMLVGGFLADAGFLLLGFLLPFMMFVINWLAGWIKLPNIKIPILQILSKRNFEYNQVLTTTLVVGLVVLVSALGLASLTTLSTSFLLSFSLLTFCILSFCAVAIASWTTIPQIQAIAIAQEKLAEANLRLESDVSKRQSLEQKLQRNLRMDLLTGLGNRLILEEKIKEFFLLRPQKYNKYAIMFLDLDRFKLVNDSLGHLVGDELLVEVAKVIKKKIGRKALVTRIGGDEFVIFFKRVARASNIVNLADDLLYAFREPFQVGEFELSTTASIGLVFGDQRYTKFDELVRDADVAMYQSKKLGRNRYTIFTELMHEKAVTEHQMEDKIRQALAHDGFTLMYQPIVSLHGEEILGFEALIRLKDGDGYISPGRFIGIAEESGLIVPITWWIIEESCRRLRGWQQQGLDFYVSLNLSNRVLSQPDLKRALEKALRNHKIQARYLRIEILESSVMNELAIIKTNLHVLAGMGIKLAVDDFGTGYSNLSRLHEMPISTLKIDRSFVVNIEDKGLEIMKTIQSLADVLEVDTVVEGVETAEELDKIRTISTQHVQGYYFAKPMLAEQVADYYLERSSNHIESQLEEV